MGQSVSEQTQNIALRGRDLRLDGFLLNPPDKRGKGGYFINEFT
jgi:hypothetical protein